jgi:hypothetical protein
VLSGTVGRYLRVERIEFAVTYRCNSRCRHCHVDSGRRTAQPASLDPSAATGLVRTITRDHEVRSVMTFGGEPLLHPGTVCSIHRAATEGGVPVRQVITNAGPRAPQQFRTVARDLADSGVNDVCVSVDAFHQEHIPVEVVASNVQALLDAGISGVRWNPAWVVSKEHDNRWNQRTRQVLAVLSHLPVGESDPLTVEPEGAALENLAEFMPPRRTDPPGECGDLPFTQRLDNLRDICVEPNGDIVVCHGFVIGSAADPQVARAIRDYDPYTVPEMRALLDGGVPALADFARSRGIEPDPAGYYSACDMCRSLRRAMARAG